MVLVVKVCMLDLEMCSLLLAWSRCSGMRYKIIPHEMHCSFVRLLDPDIYPARSTLKIKVCTALWQSLHESV